MYLHIFEIINFNILLRNNCAYYMNQSAIEKLFDFDSGTERVFIETDTE